VRFIVTSLKSSEVTARRLWERLDCASGTCKAALRSASPIYSLTAPLPAACAPISCDSGSPLWPMSCSARFAGSDLGTPASPPPPAEPRSCGCSKSARRWKKVGVSHQDCHGLGLLL